MSGEERNGGDRQRASEEGGRKQKAFESTGKERGQGGGVLEAETDELEMERQEERRKEERSYKLCHLPREGNKSENPIEVSSEI